MCILNVCSRAHRGLVCGFLVFRPQIAIEPFALFHHSVCDYMVQCDVLHIG